MICALLRGETQVWPTSSPAAKGGDNEAISSFLATARIHGTTALLNARFASGNGCDTWPAAIRLACHQDAIQQTACELAVRKELARVLEGFAAQGLAPLILKGAALAYSHYPTAALRPRSDTDLLLPPGSAATAQQVLLDLGYTRGDGVSGDLISSQDSWSRTDGMGMVHDLDVHRRISNSHILAKALDYRDLVDSARPVPELGPHAFAPAPGQALLFACMHRAGHVNAPFRADNETFIGGDRLIWLYDMHLLVGAMTAPELDAFVQAAKAKQLKAVCLEALERTRLYLGTLVPAPVLEGLQPSGLAEPSGVFLSGRPGRQMLGDFCALDGWFERLKWLKELCFPAPDYMHRKYPDATVRWLPALYVRRAASGLRKVLAGTGSTNRAV